jgi:AraC family transcriptional regulator, regulatory protein of adaptative response / methylated-DNA-[protein]-cysteine methyltransferase
MIFQTIIGTPLGDMVACATDDGICLLEFHDRRMLPTQMKRIKALFKSEVVEDEHPHFGLLRTQLAEYFQGSRKIFELPLVVPGSPFQQKAWSALQQIKYGDRRSYKQQAHVVGDLNAVRAVARANGENRLAIIIPCHRVIGADGSLVGYGGKVWRKRWLLQHEFEHS